MLCAYDSPDDSSIVNVSGFLDISITWIVLDALIASYDRLQALGINLNDVARLE